jgi:hypothetical protein
LSGRWGKEWVAWQGLPQWAGQLARDTMRKIVETRLRVEFHADGDAVRVITDLISKDGQFMNHLTLHGNVTGPNRSTQQQRFRQIAPGRYEGEFMPFERGTHWLTLFTAGSAGEAPLSMATIPYVAPYPNEYRELRPNLGLLSRFAEETGGEMLDAENLAAGLKRLYTPSLGKGFRGQETWWPLAGAGLILFLADLVLRSWPRQARNLLLARH